VVVVTPQYVNLLAEQMRTNHPALRAAAARTNAAKLKLESVRSWEDPMLKVGGLGAGTGMRADEGDVIYGFEQKLPLFGKPERTRQVAKSGLDVEQARADYLFQTLRRELAKTLFRAALAERELDIGKEDLGWLETMAAAAQERYRVGESTQAQVLRLQSEHARLSALLVSDGQRREQEWTSLNRLLNRQLQAPWPRLALPPLAGAVVYDERLVNLALRYEPKLKMLERQIKQAQAEVELTRRRRWPDLSLGTEARSYSGNGGFRQAMVTLSLNVPWGNAAKYRRDINREEANLQAVELDVADYALSVREEVRKLALALEAVRSEALAYRGEIIPRSEQALASAHAAWSANRGMFYDVLEARRMLIEARLMYARAVAEQYQMLSELVLCCGLGDLEALVRIGAQPEAEGPAANQPQANPR
jgi:outer membrane protein TolC